MSVIINGDTGVSGVDGSAATPSFQGTDTNTGIFYPAADTIAFAEGGTEVMRINSSGNVGIGTTSITAIYGSTLQIGSGTANGTVSLTGSGAGTTGDVYLAGTVDTALLFARTSTPLAFGTNDIERMRIDSSGNVGIGTTSPAYPLTVGNSTAPTNITTLNALFSTDTTNGANTSIRKSCNAINGPNVSLLKSRGTAASPTAVNSGDFIGAINFNAYGGTNYTALSAINAIVDTYTSDTNISSYLTFSTSPSGSATATERMRIDSNGVITSGLGGMQVISGTAVTASGTTVPFTGIPSWVKRITIMFDSISLNGAGEYLVQLGTSGGYVTSGYSSGCGYNQGNNVTRYATNTTGFLFTWDHNATANLTGTMDLVNITGNTWVASGNSFSPTGATGTYNNAGSIALSGTLNSLRLLSTVGTESWDAGTINILYE